MEEKSVRIVTDKPFVLWKGWAVFWRSAIAAFVFWVVASIIFDYGAARVISGVCAIAIPVVLTIAVMVNEAGFASRANRLHWERVKQLETEQRVLKVKLDRQINNLWEMIRCVPPKYRHTYAISYFVDVYKNSQVDNLKEAVNAFEQHLHQIESFELQKQILTVQERQEVLLSKIDFCRLHPYTD